MVTLINCHSCHKDEGVDIVGSLVDHLLPKEVDTLIKLYAFRCDSCFSNRIALIEDVITTRAKDLESKPKVLVKRIG